MWIKFNIDVIFIHVIYLNLFIKHDMEGECDLKSDAQNILGRTHASFLLNAFTSIEKLAYIIDQCVWT